jgi:hypothetical protein
MAGNNLDLIVDVQVTRDVQPLTQVDFNAVLFVTDEQVFTDRFRQYSRAQDLITDGFSVDSPTYQAALTYFSQSPKPSQLAIGRRDASEVAITMSENQVVNSQDYTIVVGGTSYTHSASATSEDDKPQAIDDILNALQILVNADTDVTGVISGTLGATVLTITEDNDTTVAASHTNFGVAWTTQESWAAALTAIESVYCTWYAVATYDHTVAGCLAIASEVEAKSKLYFTSNSHADNLLAVPDLSTPTADDLLGQLEAFNYDRTAFVYSGTADDTFIEMALLGAKMTTIAGRTTWDLTPVKGVIADNITRTNITNLEAKGGNYFTNFGGIDYIRQGTVVSGEWIDTMRGSDNMASDMQIELVRIIATANKSGRKIPLTDKGVGVLIGGAESIMEIYVDRDFVKEYVQSTDSNGNVKVTAGYTVTAGLVGDLPSNQRAARVAPDLQVVAYLAGAVHKAKVLINLFV